MNRPRVSARPARASPLDSRTDSTAHLALASGAASPLQNSIEFEIT
jgi:hypothetical protein